MSIDPNQLLTEKEAAKLLDLSPGTLQIWRSVGRYDLPFVKVGSNVRYRYQDIIDYIERNTMKHTPCK